MMLIMTRMAIMTRMVMVMMMRVPPQFSAFLLVATRSLALRTAWFSGSTCVSPSSPNGLASSCAGRALLHSLHGHWVGGGLEVHSINRNCSNRRIDRTQQKKRDSAIKSECSDQPQRSRPKTSLWSSKASVELYVMPPAPKLPYQ